MVQRWNTYILLMDMVPTAQKKVSKSKNPLTFRKFLFGSEVRKKSENFDKRVTIFQNMWQNFRKFRHFCLSFLRKLLLFATRNLVIDKKVRTSSNFLILLPFPTSYSYNSMSKKTKFLFLWFRLRAEIINDNLGDVDGVQICVGGWRHCLKYGCLLWCFCQNVCKYSNRFW